MELYKDPFEMGVSPQLLGGGWTTGHAFNPVVSTATPRKDASGGGGNRFLRVNGGPNWCQSPPFPAAARELYLRFGARQSNSAAHGRLELRTSDSQVGIDLLPDMYWAATRNGTVLETSASNSYSTGQWYLVQAHVYLHDSAGRAEIRVDGSTVVDYTGDTLGGADPDCTAVRYAHVTGTGTAWDIDDLVIYAPSLAYTGGTGDAPVVGEVLTGTGGGQVTVTSVLSGSDGAAGRVVVHGWNDAPFAATETLAGSEGVVAQVHAPTLDYVAGLEPQSGWPRNGHLVYLPPSADGAHRDLVPSTGSDGYAVLDEVPPVTSTYVEGTAAGEKSTFGHAGLPPSAEHVNSVSVIGVLASDLLGLDNREMILRYAGTDYFTPVAGLASSAQIEIAGWDTAPDGSGYFTPAALAAAEFGVRVS